jgi:hypothetical protein
MKKSSFGKIFFAFIACVALASTPTSSFAQRGGGGGSHGGSMGGGFHGGSMGGGGFRSGFVARGPSRRVFIGPGFRGRFVNRSFPRNRFFFPPNRFFFPHNRFFFFPSSRFFFGFGGFGYPISSYLYPYAYAYGLPSYPYPYAYDYSSPSSAPVDREAEYYLIAFYDQTIQAAVSFWVEGDAIHWISREQEHRQAPLSSLDRQFSEELNRNRGVEFKLP